MRSSQCVLNRKEVADIYNIIAEVLSCRPLTQQCYICGPSNSVQHLLTLLARPLPEHRVMRHVTQGDLFPDLLKPEQ